MRKTNIKLLSCLLSICLIVVSSPINVFAKEKDFSTNVESYTDITLDVIFERFVEDDKITVIIKSLDGTVLNILEDHNGKIYLDGELLSTKSTTSVVFTKAEFNSGHSRNNWGPWLTNTLYISTGGYTTAIIAGLIALNLGFTPWGVTWAIASITAGKYDELAIDIRMRYRSDDTYHYYERVTTFYGDGNLIIAPSNPYRDSGKTSLY